MKEQGEIRGRLIGAVLTLAVHIAALLTVSFSGIRYIYPPPPENTFLLDFEEEVEKPVQERRGRQPQAEKIDRSEPINLVQKSKSPIETTRPNLTSEGTPDSFGDVETPAPEPKEPEINKNSLFPGMAKKDTSIASPHGAREASAEFKAGQADGNTNTGRTDGKPNAHVKGRNVVGNIPRPVYNVQERGVVVVTIWVDNYGSVQKAVPGGDGTTVTDKTLWAAARKAAMETHFNMSADAPAMQEGTITYHFNLN